MIIRFDYLPGHPHWWRQKLNGMTHLLGTAADMRRGVLHCLKYALTNKENNQCQPGPTRR